MTGIRILFWLVMIALLLVGGILTLDILGVMDAQKTFPQVFSLMGQGDAKNSVESPIDDAFLLEKLRLQKDQEFLEIKREELTLGDMALVEREKEIKNKEDTLVSLEEKIQLEKDLLEKALSRYNDEQKNLVEVVNILNNIPPQDAVSRLEKMDVDKIVEIFRKANTVAEENNKVSLVSVWFSGLSQDIAAKVAVEMTIRPQI